MLFYQLIYYFNEIVGDPPSWPMKPVPLRVRRARRRTVLGNSDEKFIAEHQRMAHKAETTQRHEYLNWFAIKFLAFRFHVICPSCIASEFMA